MRFTTFAAASAILLCVITSPDVFAGNINVSNLKDSGGGSLRDAIQKANTQKSDPKKGPPVIQFSKNLAGTILLTSGTLVISADMVINGPGANNLTVKRDPSSPPTSVFQVNFGAVNLSGLTINGGNNPTGGGGIYNVFGSLTLSDCMVVGNTGSPGGGIFNGPGATIEVSDSTVANNTSSGLGGGICNGVAGVPLAGTLTLVNSTVANNTAANGGGIYNVFGSTLFLTNVTIAYNTASANGGGLYNEAQVTTNIANTIVALNMAATGMDVYAFDSNRTPPDLIKSSQPDKNSLGNNLIGQTSGSSGWVPSDQQNVAAPLLGPLTQNGGTTKTIALLAGSPAIDAGSKPLALDPSGAALGYDQRGSGFPRIVGASVDVGAFEVQTPQVSQTARQWKTAAVTLLSSSLPTGNAATDKQFKEAIEEITESLEPKLWIDDSHLVGDGGEVFDEEEEAAEELTDYHIQSASVSIAQEAIKDLIIADSLLAATEINAALAGNANELAQAQQAFAAAQSATGKQAIEYYEQAFQHAYKAVPHPDSH